MSTIRLAFLGTPQLARNGQALELHIAKVQALLAYLALTRQAQSREHLLGLLWAESHGDAARKNLRNRLWQLRQTLGEEAIITEGDTLALGPTVWSDVATFVSGVQQALSAEEPTIATLESLLHLWRGPLLAGLILSEAPDFELWLTTERGRLAGLYMQALMQLLSLKRKAGDWQGIITWAQRGLDHDPLAEPLHQQLISAYGHQGLRSEAIRQYEQLKALLITELQVEPLPETQALYAATIQPFNQPTVSANGMSQLLGLNGMTAMMSPPYSQPTVHPFVGREAQLAVLDQALRESTQGPARVVLLSGELGMGKTTLWQQWLARLAPIPVALTTRALNTTQQVPFDPIRRLLGTLPCREQLQQIANQLLPTWRHELVRLVPSLGTLMPPSMPPLDAHLSPQEERGLLAEALTQFFRAFGGTPLILLLDDLHWTDNATLDWLLYLTDRMAAEPLLLIGAYRPQDVTPPLARLISQWQREGILQRLELPSFTTTESQALLVALGANPQMVDYLHLQSGGNPYYLTQLSDIAVDGIPATLVELIQARLGYLDEAWQPVLQAAAILEPTLDVALLAQTSGRAEEAIIDALDGLLAAGIIVERGEGYEFAHGLVAKVLRDGLSSSRRKWLHRRAAAAIQTQQQGELATVAGALAHHYRAAGELDAAARFAELAGAEALRIGAAQEAVIFYEQAYALQPTADRQLGLGMALLLLPGKMAEARQVMEAALVAYEAANNCQGASKVGLRLAGSYLGTQEGAQVIHWAQRVMPDLDAVADPTLHASAHYLVGTAKFRSDAALAEAEAHYVQATELVTAHKLDSEIALMSWFEWGNLCLERGDYAAAIDKFEQAQRVAQSSQSLLFAALALNNLAYATLLTGATASAQTLIDRALAHAQTYALWSVEYYLFSTKGEIALARREWAAAKAAFQQAITLAQKYDNHTFVANVQAHLGRVALAQGHVAEAEGQLERARRVLRATNAQHLLFQIELWLVEAALARGAGEVAAHALHQLEANLRTTDYRQLKAFAAQLQSQLAPPAQQA